MLHQIGKLMHSDRSSGKLNRRARIQSLITGEGRGIRRKKKEKSMKKKKRHQKRGVTVVDTKYSGGTP